MIQCLDCDSVVEKLISDRVDYQRERAIAKELADSGLHFTLLAESRSWNSIRSEIKNRTTPEDFSAFDYLKQKHIQGLYLTGATGTYKTSAAAAMLTEEIRNGGSGKYVSVQSLFTELFGVYAANSTGSRADIIARYADAPNLILDDLGKEKPTEHSGAVLLELLDIRYRKRSGWMIITSNFPLYEIMMRIQRMTDEALAESIVRRIAEMCVVVEMK